MEKQAAYSYVPYQVVDVSDSPNLRATLFRYLRNWPWFLLSVTLLLAAAYAYLLFQQPIYKIQASLLVKDEKKGLGADNLLKELEIFAPKAVVENEIEILKSYTLMDKVVGRLNLDLQYFASTPFGKREIYGESPVRLIVERPRPELYEEQLTLSFPGNHLVRINDVSYPLNQSIQTPYGRLRVFARKALTAQTDPVIVQALPRVETVNNYVKNLKAEPTSKAATVIALTLEDAVPSKGEAILNQLIEEYNQAAIADKNVTAANTLNFIEERLKLISGELATVEKDVELYKSTQGITDLSVQAQTFLETVKNNDAQLNQVNLQLGALGDIERYVNSREGEQGVTPSTLGLSDPVLLGLITQVTTLQLQRDQLARTMSPQNPALQSLDNQIKVTKSNIAGNIATMKAMLTTSRQQLQANNGKLEGVIRTIPSKERALLDITRQQAIKNNLYTYLLEKREETAVSYAATISDSRTIDAARGSVKPVKPVKAMIFLLFGLVGLMLPVGAMATRDALNNRVTRRADVEGSTHVPILGEVTKNKNAETLVLAPRSRSVIAEQIRTLRTNLQFLRTNAGESQVLLFTSSISGEGKSFVSLNLGASLALVDRKTVILEMDLRKPGLRSSVDVANSAGITNYLIGEATVDEVLQPVPGHDNYFIIPSGPIPPNPSELLSGPRLETLFADLRQRFDYVIVDSPPIGLVTDAQLIAPFADATLFMVRHDVTPKNNLRMIEALHKEHRFKKLNIILNAVGEGESYYYSYGYGYNKYYSDEKTSEG
jgi:capsular exopolysaccharide synthesis family protein